MRMDEKGVSPVIGVILMVAITVILAAVIASFVFGLSGSVKRSYIVTFADTRIDKDNVYVKYMGGPDHSYVQSCSAVIEGAQNNVPIGAQNQPPGIGVTYTIQHKKNSGESFDFAIICTFTDGSTQTVLSTRLTVP